MFIYRLLNCHNCIVKECLTVGINNSNTIIGYKLAFIRSRFGINALDTGYVLITVNAFCYIVH